MKRRPGRRNVRKRKHRNQNNRVKIGGFLGIIILAVFLGFLTARFVVGPLIGYDASESPAKIAGDEKEETDVENSGSETNAAQDAETSAELVLKDGYALQFGAFSTKEAAEELAESLKSQGIKTDIVRVEKIYKVIGPVMDTREEALDSLNKLPEMGVEDVFITTFS